MSLSVFIWLSRFACPPPRVDALCDALLDDVLVDTVTVLNQHEQLNSIESAQHDNHERLALALRTIDAFAAELSEARSELAQAMTSASAATMKEVETPQDSQIIEPHRPIVGHVSTIGFWSASTAASTVSTLSPASLTPASVSSSPMPSAHLEVVAPALVTPAPLFLLPLPLPPASEAAVRAHALATVAARGGAAQWGARLALPVQEAHELVADVHAARSAFEQTRAADEVVEALLLAERYVELHVCA